MKKKFLMFGIFSLLALTLLTLTLVTAGILKYYKNHQETLNIIQPILVNGAVDNLFDCEAGQLCKGSPLTIENQGSYPIPVILTTKTQEDSSIENIFYINFDMSLETYCENDILCIKSDFDESGVVEEEDWKLLRNNFGKEDCSFKNNWCDGTDINENGKVGLDDWGVFRSNFGKQFNGDGKFIIDSGQILELTPYYKVNALAESGTETVITTVNPAIPSM